MNLGTLGLFLLLVCSCQAEAESELEYDYPELSLPTTTLSTKLTTIASTVPTTTKDYCRCDLAIYGLDDLDGVLKSPNYPGSHCNSGQCIYKILPHPNMTVRLYVQSASFSMGTTLRFYNIFDVNGEEYELYHSHYAQYDRNGHLVPYDLAGYETWTTAKGVGLKIIFEPKVNLYVHRGFKITFERRKYENEDYICTGPVLTVGLENTTVLEPKPFSVSAGCTYLLTPAGGAIARRLEEMYIDIRTEQGTYVAVRSYDDIGRFVQDVFSDYSRIRMVDASRVEILVRRSQLDKGTFKMPLITAKLMNQTCRCSEREQTFDANNSKITIRSPGFPHLYCPGKTCRTFITPEKLDKGNLVPLIMISTNCTLSQRDNLSLFAPSSAREIFRTRVSKIFSRYLRPVITDEQDLRVTYHASEELRSRYFEMNLTRVYVPPECVCSNFDDNDNYTTGSVAALIPAKCRILHCHWKFSAGDNHKYISLEFRMSSLTYGDKVYIITEKTTEEYGSEQLTHKRRLTSASSPIEFTFSRFNLTAETDSVLNVTWKIGEACTCPDDKFDLKTDQPVVLTSPNYPEMYCPNQVCRHTFYAPEGHFLEVRVDDSDIELYHDFLEIYDGNRTGGQLLAKLSGQEKNVFFNTTSNIAVFLFSSDEGVGNKGFHANIIAHRFPITDEPAPVSLTVKILSIFVFIVCVVIAGFAMKELRKMRQQNHFRTLHNPTASYSTSETGESVNLSFGSQHGLIVDNAVAESETL